MELPRKVLVGYGALEEFASFLSSLGLGRRLLMVSGEHIGMKLKSRVDKMLSGSFEHTWLLIRAADMATVREAEASAEKIAALAIVGLGGGKSVDVAKLSSFNKGLPFVSVPTSASHDGISSPFASIKGLSHPYSFVAKPPIGILADIDLISEAPKELLASGCADLIAKFTAVKDWELASKEKGEYFGQYAASLALLSAEITMRESKNIGNHSKNSIRSVVEALISAGVAAGIAGSSRPCSGSEHLFSHAIDVLAPGLGLHGQKVGLGSIMMSKLHGLSWRKVRDSLHHCGAPLTASQIGLSKELVVKAIVKAPSIRPERYTILHKLKLGSKEALDLAESVEVL